MRALHRSLLAHPPKIANNLLPGTTLFAEFQLQFSGWFTGTHNRVVRAEIFVMGKSKLSDWQYSSLNHNIPSSIPPPKLCNGHCYWQSFGNNSNTPTKSWEIIREMLTMDSHKQEQPGRQFCGEQQHFLTFSKGKRKLKSFQIDLWQLTYRRYWYILECAVW